MHDCTILRIHRKNLIPRNTHFNMTPPYYGLLFAEQLRMQQQSDWSGAQPTIRGLMVQFGEKSGGEGGGKSKRQKFALAVSAVSCD